MAGAGITAAEVDLFRTSPEATDELVREVLWRTIDQIPEINRSQRRVITAAAALAGLFELLNRSLIAEASFAGVRLSRLEFFQALVPVDLARP